MSARPSPVDRSGCGRVAREASFLVELTSPDSPSEVFSRLLDLRRHDRLVPLTRVSPALPAEELRVGQQFVAHTGLGGLGFDDRMVVEQLSIGTDREPIAVRIAKRGRVIQGSIRLEIAPTRSGSALRWQQFVGLPWLPSMLQTVAARAMQVLYRWVLVRLLDVDHDS